MLAKIGAFGDQLIGSTPDVAKISAALSLTLPISVVISDQKFGFTVK